MFLVAPATAKFAELTGSGVFRDKNILFQQKQILYQ